MSDKFYVWKGPPTAVDIWKEGTKDGKPEIIFSGAVAPGKVIPEALPSDHSQVRSWLDFGLLEEKTSATESEPATTESKPAATESKPVKGESKKETTNG